MTIASYWCTTEQHSPFCSMFWKHMASKKMMTVFSTQIQVLSSPMKYPTPSAFFEGSLPVLDTYVWLACVLCCSSPRYSWHSPSLRGGFSKAVCSFPENSVKWEDSGIVCVNQNIVVLLPMPPKNPKQPSTSGHMQNMSWHQSLVWQDFYGCYLK